MKTQEELKTFEDACKLEGYDAKTVLPKVDMYPTHLQKFLTANAKLAIIVQAANRLENNGEIWTPDFSNWDENKYEPWFELEEGSSGFRYDVYGRWFTGSAVGSRLCFISRELCEHVAKTFIDIYRDIHF